METRRMVRKDANRQASWATDCPLTAALQVIGGRWSLITLYWLEQNASASTISAAGCPRFPTRCSPPRSATWSVRAW